VAFVVTAVAVAVIRPHRAAYMNSLSIVACLLLGVRASIQTMSATVRSSPPQAATEIACFYALLAWSLIQSVIDLCVGQCERVLWTRHREDHQRCFAELLHAEILLAVDQSLELVLPPLPTAVERRAQRQRKIPLMNRKKSGQQQERREFPAVVELSTSSCEVSKVVDDDSLLATSSSSSSLDADDPRHVGREESPPCPSPPVALNGDHRESLL
jgi:hypothetical protein